MGPAGERMVDIKMEIVINGLKERLELISNPNAVITDAELLRKDYIGTLKLLIRFLSTIDEEDPETIPEGWVI